MPKFSVASRLHPHNKFAQLDEAQSLIASINENEMGPLVFNDNENDGESVLKNSGNLNEQQQQHFAIYDLDLGENATFETIYSETSHPESSIAVEKLANHLKFGPHEVFNEKIRANSISGGYSSLIAFNHEPFDFDTLNVTPIVDPSTGIASKYLKFNVMALSYIILKLYILSFMMFLLRHFEKN